MTNAAAGAPWLLGTVGAPVIPPSWGLYPCPAPPLTFTDGRVISGGRKSLADMAQLGATGRGNTAIDWCATAPQIARALASAIPGWLGEPIGAGVDETGTLRDLPLLASTHEALTKRRLNRSVSIARVAALPRSDFLDDDDGPIALLDLSVLLECWWPRRQLSPLHCAISYAVTLEEVAQALLREYIALDGNRLDERWVTWILRRFSWGMPAATLDEIGKEAGVTRERVRQVITRIEARAEERIWPLPAVVAEALETLRDNGFRDAQEVLVDSGFALDDDWTPEEVTDLLRWLGYPQAAEVLAGNFRMADGEAQAERQADAELIAVIRAARSAMGFLRIDAVEAPGGGLIDEEEVLRVLSKAYARVYRHGPWALAGDGATTTENIAQRQLGITAPLPGPELHEGLVREQRRRSQPAIPAVEITLALLEHAGAIHQLPDGRYAGPQLATDPTTLNGFLIRVLSEVDGYVLHREQINRHAIQERLNLTSVAVYTSFSYVVRPCEGGGLYRLVGAFPTDDELEHAMAVAEATRVHSELQWTATATGLDLSLVVGSNLLAMGSLSVPTALNQLWPDGGAKVECLCSRSFSGRVNAYANTMLGNWSSLLTHLAQVHGLREATTVALRVTGDVMRVLRVE